MYAAHRWSTAAAVIAAKLFQVLLSPDENTCFINNLGNTKPDRPRGGTTVAPINPTGVKHSRNK